MGVLVAPRVRSRYRFDEGGRVLRDAGPVMLPQLFSEPDDVDGAPLFGVKAYGERSVFTASSLLREARRQRGLPARTVPRVCMLDPDGDLTRYLHEAAGARVDSTWACYHTTRSRFVLAGREVGIVPFAVGAPFAVLVAEELMASGCGLLSRVQINAPVLPALKRSCESLSNRCARAGCCLTRPNFRMIRWKARRVDVLSCVPDAGS